MIQAYLTLSESRVNLIMVKRGLDLTVAIVLLLLVFPVLLLVIIISKYIAGLPVFFTQQRPGYLGRPFYIYKLCTMTNEHDSTGELLPDDQRLTRYGQFLRKTSLDELPQLWNVIKGDISLVGPRPLLMEYLPLYNSEQARRHEVKPGVTGWAQVNGRNAISWEQKFEYDVWDVEHQSLWLDFKILWMTLLKVVKGQDVQQHGHVTMARFKGSE